MTYRSKGTLTLRISALGGDGKALDLLQALVASGEVPMEHEIGTLKMTCDQFIDFMARIGYVQEAQDESPQAAPQEEAAENPQGTDAVAARPAEQEETP